MIILYQMTHETNIQHWDKDDLPLTAGKIYENRTRWNNNMIHMLEEQKADLLRRIAGIDSSISQIKEDSLKLATSPQIMKPRGVYKTCRFNPELR